jgi:hypothetical protein
MMRLMIRKILSTIAARHHELGARVKNVSREEWRRDLIQSVRSLSVEEEAADTISC